MILDIFSRYVVGWTVQHQETAPLAERLIAETLAKQKIARSQLTIHADRGSAMRSKPVAFLLADLGVTKTHSRPYTSTDNPYSEAHFKTLKNRPGFPARFTSILEARAFWREFFAWYNEHHRHSGIGLMTPSTVHHGLAEQTHAARCRRPRRRLPRDPRAVRPPTTTTTSTPNQRVDQQTRRHRGDRSLNSRPICLTELDRLRAIRGRVAGGVLGHPLWSAGDPGGGCRCGPAGRCL